MTRRRLVSTLAGVGALVLAGCGGGAEVAVEEPPAPAPAASAESSAPSDAEPVDVSAGDDFPTALGPEEADPPADPAGDEPAEPAGTAAAPDDGRAREAADAPAGQGDGGGSGPEAATVEQDGDTATETGAGESPEIGDGPPAIAIERPLAGSRHRGGPVTAEGEATVYEGTVLLTLVAPDGSVVEEAFATATAGAPERGRWSHTFTAAMDAPGRWQVVAAATDPSDGEGHPPARTVTEFHVGRSR